MHELQRWIVNLCQYCATCSMQHNKYEQKPVVWQTFTPQFVRGIATKQHSAISEAAKLAGITETEDVVAFTLGYQQGLALKKKAKARSAASVRINETDSPVIVQMQDILKNAKDCLSLAQGERDSASNYCVHTVTRLTEINKKESAREF